jgi:class 3 adenylate cyclase
VDQQIRFCRNAAGVRIAYSTMGSGPPLVIVPGWVSHLEEDLKVPARAEFFKALAERFAVVRYDKGGTGMSDRALGSYTLDSRLADLEAVVSSLKLKKFSIFALSEGGPIAIAYTSRHPRNVPRLVLYGTYARGAELAPLETQKALVSLVRSAWGIGSETLTSMFMPGATAEEVRDFLHYQRAAARAEDAAALMEAVYAADVSDLLPSIKAPTLVFHARGDRAIRYRHGLEIAAGIPGARMVTLDTDRHAGTPETMAQVMEAVIPFLAGGQPGVGPAEGNAEPVEQGMLTLMFTDMVGSTPLTQRLGDAKAQEFVRRHNAAVRDALKAHGGHEVKHTGDGIMASFATASHAIQCALEVQSKVGADGDLRVRIGLNAGEPVAEENDLFGSSVQMAARVCAEAAGGQVLVTNVVRELAAGKGFLFSETGVVALKGFDDPVRLFEVRPG